MATRQETDVLFRKEIKYPSAIGDWTRYRPVSSPIKLPSYIPYKISKISNRELSRFLDIHAQFTHKFLASLQDSLKLSTDMYVANVEQLFYGNFLARMDIPLLYAKLFIKDIGEIMVCIDFSLINSIINFSLGCPSKIISPRNLTEVEESIITNILQKNLDNFLSCWQNVFPKPELRIISCPALTREPNLSLNDVVTQFTAVASLSGSQPSRITFIYQSSVLRALLDRLGIREQERPLDLKKLPSNILETMEMPVTVELGDTHITANEMISMEPDDIIRLDAKLGSLMRVKIGEKISLVGQPGVKNKRYAVRIIPMKAGLMSQGERPTIVESDEGRDLPEATAKASTEEKILPQGDIIEELPMEEAEKGEYNTAEEENLFGGDEPYSKGGQ